MKEGLGEDHRPAFRVRELVRRRMLRTHRAAILSWPLPAGSPANTEGPHHVCCCCHHGCGVEGGGPASSVALPCWQQKPGRLGEHGVSE